ncbi:HAD family hydrolase [Dysgonomonas macrotermitis]|uniref:Putative hydrolase of the HAD superfamily n=1 Tax=Dysgonomonas macrotermitis TaxID=1346286 RepID=A0A1M5IL34_9BACT|nr:HAD family phosphatase [Dysgonomonas macrotermitis]SHG28997.1 putative hydrolase of the HAD superfamily [Dysgonomonas macrotermitis]
MELNIPNFPVDEIENIIFDFGGVIMDINIGRTLAAFNNLKIEGMKSDDIISGHKKFLLDLELGLITPSQFVEAIYTEYPAAKNVNEKDIWDAWNALLQPYDRARIEMLERVNARYRTYLLSNTNFPHRVKFKEMYRKQFGENFDDLFIQCFYSDEMHLRKPDQAIYKEVMETIRLNPQRTLFIDDNEANITGAREYGLWAYHLTGGESISDLFVPCSN